MRQNRNEFIEPAQALLFDASPLNFALFAPLAVRM
jgi:hypothetical protein